MLDFLRDFFLSRRSRILQDLPSCKTVEQLDVFSEQLRSQMLGEYSRVLFAQSHKVDSFNRTRNLMDLYIEHLVAMADELAHLRSQLVPLLFLPLTSQIFDSGIFSSDELKKAKVSEKSTFGPTPTNKALIELQNELLEHIGQKYAVDSVEIEDGADDCLLLGIVEDDE